MDQELRDKVSRLPAWARDLIKKLEEMPRLLADEAVKLRKEEVRLKAVVRKQQDQINAMVEMFQCAAKGGNEVASAVARIVEEWIVEDSE